MRRISLACGFHTVTPLYPTARPALREHHKLPSTSQRVVPPALHPINHEIGEELLIGELVVRPNIEDVYVAFAAGPGIARAGAGADHVELLVVKRKEQPVRIRDLVLSNDDIEPSVRVGSVDIGRQLALPASERGRSPEPRI